MTTPASGGPVDGDRHPQDITILLDQASQGNSDALKEAFPLLREQVHVAARALMHKAPQDLTLQATGLMHEAYIKTAEACAAGTDAASPRWNDRRHFIHSQVHIMKNLLVDAAKKKGSLKRGAGRTRMQLSDESLGPRSPEDVTLFVHDACRELAMREPRAAELAHLHYFGDFTWSEAGELLGLSDRERKSLRQFADAWFLKELED